MREMEGGNEGHGQGYRGTWTGFAWDMDRVSERHEKIWQEADRVSKIHGQGKQQVAVTS
jgi:hypothetical protein